MIVYTIKPTDAIEIGDSTIRAVREKGRVRVYIAAPKEVLVRRCAAEGKFGKIQTKERRDAEA